MRGKYRNRMVRAGCHLKCFVLFLKSASVWKPKRRKNSIWKHPSWAELIMYSVNWGGGGGERLWLRLYATYSHVRTCSHAARLVWSKHFWATMWETHGIAVHLDESNVFCGFCLFSHEAPPFLIGHYVLQLLNFWKSSHDPERSNTFGHPRHNMIGEKHEPESPWFKSQLSHDFTY